MPAHQVSPQALPAFVNPCCSHHVGIAKPFVSPSPTAPFINISCRSCSFFSSFSLYLSFSLHLLLFSLSVLLAKEKRFISSSPFISRKWTEAFRHQHRHFVTARFLLLRSRNRKATVQFSDRYFDRFIIVRRRSLFNRAAHGPRY